MLLSRLGFGLLVLALLIFVAALYLSWFPRTLTGVAVLLTIGVPVIAVGAVLVNVAFWSPSLPWSLRAGAFIGFLALAAVLWWWCSAHASFMHRNFVG